MHAVCCAWQLEVSGFPLCCAAFVLEPTLGSALNKGAQGMVGAVIGAALGIGSQAIAEELVGRYDYNTNSAGLVSAFTSASHGLQMYQSHLTALLQ